MPSVLHPRRQRRDRHAEPAGRDVGELVVRVADPDQPDRRAPLAALTGALAASARKAGLGAVVAGRWLADVLADVAPRIPVRGVTVLRSQHLGLTDDEIADVLVKHAARATAAL